jgi:large subunit ribosomal protein L33
MAKASARVIITMACTVCKARNYATYKNKKNDSARIELNKFCSSCGHHTAHRETR